jgi:hypothetical protein
LSDRIKEECDGKLEGRRRHSWEDNIEIVLDEKV